MRFAELTGPVLRGVRNPLRSKARTTVVVVLLAVVTGSLALAIQAAFATRQQIAMLEARVRTQIELREAGAFGTGGFGGDKPVGEEHFSTDTLERVQRLASARHVVRLDEYVYTPQVDARRKNAYAMLIGLRPGSALRAIGEVDYENARIVAGRAFRAEDAGAAIAIVGRLYAEQRLGVGEANAAALEKLDLALGGRRLQVIGIYSTGNDFGDNHDPALVLADEPTGNLDSKTGQMIYELLREVSLERTVLVVTHAEALAQMATRVVHLKDGRLAEES